MINKKEFSTHSLHKSFIYAFRGIISFFKTECNAWIHLTGMAAVVIAGYSFNITQKEWCLLVFAIGIVFVSEVFNTSIECLTDMISPDYDERAGKVKDLSAGAVLVSAITALAIGLIIFVPRII
jgi:diacylglycerol kinase (ATP)